MKFYNEDDELIYDTEKPDVDEIYACTNTIYDEDGDEWVRIENEEEGHYISNALGAIDRIIAMKLRDGSHLMRNVWDDAVENVKKNHPYPNHSTLYEFARSEDIQDEVHDLVGKASVRQLEIDMYGYDSDEDEWDEEDEEEDW